MTPNKLKSTSAQATVLQTGKRVLLSLCLLLFFSAGANSEVVELTDGSSGDYRPQFSWLVDDTGQATLEQIQQLPAQAFTASGKQGITLGFIRGVVWLHFDVVNHSSADTTWLLQIPDPLLDDIRVYQSLANSQWQESQLGDLYPQANAALDSISPALPLVLEAGKVTRFYLRIQSKSSMLVDVRLLSGRQFFKVGMASFLGYGAMFGIVTAMCLYNLFLYISLRDPNYLLYVVSISTTALFLASLSGHAPHWLWPDYRPWSEEFFQCIVAVTLVSGLWFCTRFLEAKLYAPRLHKIILGLIALALLSIPLVFTLGFRISVELTGPVSAMAGATGLLTAAVCLRRGQRSARYYLLAWAGYCVGTIFTAARQHGVVENSFITVHGMEMGAVLETVLISFALSDRYNQLKLAKEQAQHETEESLRRMDKLKDEFLANTSHELRTPLQGIIGLAEAMLDGVAGKMGEAAEKNLSLIVSSGFRLTNLVNDILDFSKMKNHELKLRQQPVDLHVVVDVVMRLSAPMAQLKSLELINAVDKSGPVVLADEDRLQQILHNLIGNAVKFTDAGTVRVNAVEEGALICIEVTDTGPGISAEDQQRIFESFEQVEESTTRSHGGTGLGLAVTRKLIELHGSSIGVSSTLGEGSTFSFALPRASSEQAAIASSPASSEVVPTLALVHSSNSVGPAAVKQAVTKELAEADKLPVDPSSRIRILVVDDEPVNQQVMENHLVGEDYEVVQAESGVTALELMRNGEHFDLILLDVMMPVLSGFEVCSEIRKTHLPTQLPIVMVTARTQMQDLKLGLQMGANDFITKPVAKEELLARIKTHLNLLRINAAYSHYVPHEFLRFLQRDSMVDVQLGDNVEMDAAVFVSDIRSFTTLSETMTPDENFSFINSYFAVAGPPIRRHNGFIDHYVGDGIMAVFPGGADDALAAARDTMAGLLQFNTQRESEGEVAIRIGIGLHLGSLRLGIVGEDRRRQGDIFADCVNVASRIEGQTKVYGCSVIVSGVFLKSLSNPDSLLPVRRTLGNVHVKGRQQAVMLHEAFEFDSPELAAHKTNTRAAFEQAQAHFQALRYTDALALLGPILGAHDGDVPARHLHAQVAAGLHRDSLNV